MKTGQEARQLGLYASDCCDHEMIFDKGDCFCACAICKRFCEWELVETIVLWNGIDRSHEIDQLAFKAA